MAMKRVAAILLVNERQEFLLYLRDNKISIPYPGHWALIGGHLEEGESSIDALKRETFEEIGISLDIDKVEYLGSFDDLADNEVLVYLSEIDKEVEELELNEGQKLGYFSFEEILRIKIPEVFKNFMIMNKSRIIKN